MMNGEIAVYILLLLAFIIGSIYHVNIRIKCIYPIKLTKARIILSGISLLIFCMIAYIGGNRWYYYILAFAAAIYLTASIAGEGMQEKGIYYRSLGPGSTIIRLAKWKDISDVTIDINQNKLESFKLKSTRIHPNQYYRQDDLAEIEKYINELKK